MGDLLLVLLEPDRVDHRAQLLAEESSSPEGADPRGPLRDARDRRNLRIVHAVHVAQEEGLAHRGRKAAHRNLQPLRHLVADHAREHPAAPRRLGLEHAGARRRRVAALVPQVLAAQVERDPVEPRRKLRPLLEPRDVAERRRHRLLDDVLAVAAHHHRHEPRERLAVRRDERLELVGLHSYLLSSSLNIGRFRSSPSSLSSRIPWGGAPSLSAWSRCHSALSWRDRWSRASRRWLPRSSSFRSSSGSSSPLICSDVDIAADLRPRWTCRSAVASSSRLRDPNAVTNAPSRPWSTAIESSRPLSRRSSRPRSSSAASHFRSSEDTTARSSSAAG